MADTETMPDATQEHSNPTENKVDEENNNSMSTAADNPECGNPAPTEVLDGNPQEDPPAPSQDASDSKEPDSDPSIPQTECAGEEAAQQEIDAKEVEGALPQEAAQEDPKKDEEPEEHAVAVENTEKGQEQPEVAVEEMSKEENQVLKYSSPEGAEQSSESVEADAAPKQDDKRVDAEASAGAEASAETGEEVVEATVEETQEQPAENSNSNENEKQEAIAEPQNLDTPGDDQTTVSEPPAEQVPTPATEDSPVETADDARVSATTEAEPAEEDQELSDYEVKYRAAQKDIEELRSLNVEIQQRLSHSEEEARERKRQQASTEGKYGMKVQADYLARELSQQQDTEKYLREKLAEVLEEKEESERKCKDLQLRLKRFVKDDQAKDERMVKMENELREKSREVQILKQHLDEGTLMKIEGARTTNGEATTARTPAKKTETPVPQSKTCVIL